MTHCTTRAAECWAHILAQPDGYPMGVAADFARDDGSEPAEACAAVEAVAQQHLDARPDDHRARRLLGEWLTWHGDARGEGYRALAASGLYPHGPTEADCHWSWHSGRGMSMGDYVSHQHALPQVWFRAVTPSRMYWTENYPTRRAAEDAAALAFARLPAARRAELLAGRMEG